MSLEIIQTAEFVEWLRSLRDIRAADRITARILRAQDGNFGDAKFFRGIGEMRIAYGPGYRIYFVRRGDVLVVLLCGGDKGSQKRDIKRARELAKEV